ncbi:MAG: IS21 family transposase [Acidithiobacillus sp.]
MPGKWLGDTQVKRYKELRRKFGQEVAANKMGISVRTARRIERQDWLPSHREARAWRTRKDPFAAYWETEVLPLLRQAPGLLATTILDELHRRHPEDISGSHLRTLQRRIRDWRALEGPDQEIFFPQEQEPGRQGLSDFTEVTELGITVGGQLLVHRLYQFVLAYSGWRHAEVVLGGESFVALSGGLQNALWRLGGVPREHRTDHLTAAYNNQTEQEELTRRYAALCEDYGMRPTKNNLGESQENGSVEARQGSLKRAIDQALLLRGSRDFADLEGYRRFLDGIVSQLNRKIQKRLTEERPYLHDLPRQRSVDWWETTVRVSSNGVFRAANVAYSAPSRLRGYPLQVRVYADHIEAYYGSTLVVRADKGPRDGAIIDYRHILPMLRRKPGALLRYVYRDALFPHPAYRTLWERLQEECTEREACRLMVGLLDLAADGYESALAHHLEALGEGELPDLESLRQALRPVLLDPEDPEIQMPTLEIFDQLLTEVLA